MTGETRRAIATTVRATKVLLVEDNLGEAGLLKHALSRAKGDVALTHASTLADGTAMIRQTAFDIVLLDLSLPDSCGTATVERMTAVASGTPIIVLTGLDDDETGVEAVRKGAQDYLIKGKTETELLVRAIQYAIERKRVEQTLRDSEERHRTILDEMQEGVIFADAEDVIRHINACACALLGTTRGRVIGQPVLSVHPESARGRLAATLRAFREGTCWDMVTVRQLLRDRELILRFSPVRGPNGSYWGTISTLADITDQIRIQQELAEARQMERLGRVAGGIAHEFNNLMAAALGQASHLKRKLSPEHPAYAGLSQIEQSTETAGRLAHQLLAYAQGGKIRPRITQFADVVGRAVASLTSSIPPRAEVEHHVASDLGQVECDTAQMEQVIVNLGRNAVEAMPQGGRLCIKAENVCLTAPLQEARPSLTPGDYVRVSVEDSGCGMDADSLGRLFEPFYTTKPTGHGLGLAAAWGIVKSHGGAISVKTRLGEGSVFQVWLPRVRTT